jgi:hypothetical protein
MGRTGTEPPTAARTAWRERLVQAALSIVVGLAVYWRASEMYGPGAGVIAATCMAWSYWLLTMYVAHLLNQREKGHNRPRGPQAPTGRWPGARP